MKSLSFDENNPVINTIKFFQLISYDENINQLERVKRLQQLLSSIDSIFSSPSTGELFVYLVEHGATTTYVAMCDLGMPEATTYRAIKRLRQLGYLEKAIRVRTLGKGHQKMKRGGPRPVVWMLAGCEPEKVALAVNKHYRMLNPKFRIAEDLAQAILTDYLKPRQMQEVSRSFIMARAKELQVPFHRFDIGELASRILVEKGIQILW